MTLRRLHAPLMMTVTGADAAQSLHGESQGPQRRRQRAGGSKAEGGKSTWQYSLHAPLRDAWVTFHEYKRPHCISRPARLVVRSECAAAEAAAASSTAALWVAMLKSRMQGA